MNSTHGVIPLGTVWVEAGVIQAVSPTRRIRSRWWTTPTYRGVSAPSVTCRRESPSGSEPVPTYPARTTSVTDVLPPVAVTR